jgi:hypothetical protein
MSGASREMPSRVTRLKTTSRERSCLIRFGARKAAEAKLLEGKPAIPKNTRAPEHVGRPVQSARNSSDKIRLGAQLLILLDQPSSENAIVLLGQRD